jgi:hypothetical protein
LTIITPTDLKTNLEIQGITSSELEDCTKLQNLIDLKINEITALTGLPVNPVTRKQILRNFNDSLFESDWYPICKVTSFKIDGVELTADEDYVLDENAGIFYLNNHHTGLLVIEYVHRLSDETITNLINPLISDMILYGFTNPNLNEGAVSSIHEAEQSISYDTSNSLGNRIYARIDNLKSSFGSCRVRWLGV